MKAEREVIKTEDQFTFELELGSGTELPAGQQLLGWMVWITASINAGGLGSILFDGLRTMNVAKILWGSLLSALLAVGIDQLLILVERKSKKNA